MTEAGSKQQEPRQAWTIGDVLRWTTDRFAQVEGLSSPRLDAEVLLASCLEVPRIRLYIDYAKPLTVAELSHFRQAIRRRLSGEPVAHITGQREFWSLALAVDRNVLVPRPETEVLVDHAVRWLRSRADVVRRVIDVGTGSGAIAIALAREIPRLSVTAADISDAALRVAVANAARHGVDVHLVRGDLLAPFAAGCADLVVANLPYIATGSIDALQCEVAQFDPRLALDGGADGLVLFRQLIPQAARCLRRGGKIALEIGADQAAAVSVLLEQDGFGEVQTERDLAGLDRVVLADKMCN